MAGADLRAALLANCLRGALPPVDLRAVCLVRACNIKTYIKQLLLSYKKQLKQKKQEKNTHHVCLRCFSICGVAEKSPKNLSKKKYKNFQLPPLIRGREKILTLGCFCLCVVHWILNPMCG